MLRLSLLFSLVACTHPVAPLAPQPPAPVVNPPAPTVAPESPDTVCLGGHCERNFVCERVASEGNKKAICEPEYTAAGELLTHSARVTIDGVTNVCTMNDRAPMVVCAPLFLPRETTDLRASETKPAKKAPAKKK